MFHRKGLVRAAAMAALACAGIARADGTAVPDNGLTLRPVYMDAPATAPAPAAPATPDKPLMGTLRAGAIGKNLDAAGINITGFFEGGYTASFQNPPGNVITGRIFDTKHERVVLDQADIAISKSVDYQAAAKAGKFDFGADLELIYGWDSGLIHSDGLYDTPAQRANGRGAYYSSRTQPENQFDVNQAFIDVAVPVGSGLRIRAGKIVTLLGYEVINPTGNAFYSHSYMFGYAIPFTNTGIIGEYKFSDDWQLDAGITRGESQSLRDNNGDPDMMGELTWTPQGSDALKKWKFIANWEVGPEANGDNSNWWTVLDFQAIYTVNDKLTLALNADYGDAPHGLGTSSAQWGGAAVYAAYVLHPAFTLNFRGEWYEDAQGFTFGTGTGMNVYEATIGLQIKPFPDDLLGQNLVIRPELRGDYADKDFFNAGTKHFQASVGIDAYFIY